MRVQRFTRKRLVFICSVLFCLCCVAPALVFLLTNNLVENESSPNLKKRDCKCFDSVSKNLAPVMPKNNGPEMLFADSDETPSSRADLPVYIVEEHHEVIPLWFGAANKGLLPNKFNNTLIHIDAHSDFGTPPIRKEIPLFRWPLPSDLPALMTENDMFIVGASMSGIFSRVIWVWPDWDKDNSIYFYGDYMVADVTLGYWLRPLKNGLHAKDLCYCANILNIAHIPSMQKWRGFNCFKQNSKTFLQSGVDDLGKIMLPRDCVQKVHARVEIVSESRMLKMLAKKDGFDELRRDEGYILDIDEDYFSTEATVMPLYKAGLEESFITHIRGAVGDVFCGFSTIKERAVDSMFRKVIQFAIDNRERCTNSKTKRNSRRRKTKVTNPSVAYMKDQISKNQQCAGRLYQSLEKVKITVESGDQRYTVGRDDLLCGSGGDYFQQTMLSYLLSLLFEMNDDQLEAVGEMGICLSRAPRTHNLPEDQKRMRLCDGENRPNNTMVSFHSPKNKQEIEDRGDRIATMLRGFRLTPDIITVCRSVRDGYTPRTHFRQIEDKVLDVLNDVYSNDVTKIKVNYDPDLLGGAEGWSKRTLL